MPVLAESEPARLPVGTLVADELLVVESDDTSMPALLPLLCADTSRTVERPTLPRAFGPRHSNTGSIQLIVRPLFLSRPLGDIDSLPCLSNVHFEHFARDGVPHHRCTISAALETHRNAKYEHAT
jgi:hypothetical protein